MANKKTGDIEIGGRLFNTATGNIVAGADAIKDEAQGKTQAEINVETYEHVADIDAALQELSPDQTEALALATDVNTLKAKSVRSDEAQSLTAEEKAQALSNLGISGIDDVPTAGSDNLVKSSGANKGINESDEWYQIGIKDSSFSVGANRIEVPIKEGRRYKISVFSSIILQKLGVYTITDNDAVVDDLGIFNNTFGENLVFEATGDAKKVVVYPTTLSANMCAIISESTKDKFDSMYEVVIATINDDYDWQNGYINSTGSISQDSNFKHNETPIEICPNTKYRVYGKHYNGSYVRFTNAYGEQVGLISNGNQNDYFDFTSPANAYGVQINYSVQEPITGLYYNGDGIISEMDFEQNKEIKKLIVGKASASVEPIANDAYNSCKLLDLLELTTETQSAGENYCLFDFERGKTYKLNIHRAVDAGLWGVYTRDNNGVVDNLGTKQGGLDWIETFTASNDANKLTIYISQVNVDVTINIMQVVDYKLVDKVHDIEEEFESRVIATTAPPVEIYKFNGIKDEYISADDWIQGDKDISLENPSSPFESGAVVRKYFSVYNRKLVYDCVLTSNTIAIFYTQSADLESFYKQGWCVSVNRQNGTLNIHNAYGTNTTGIDTTLPSIYKSVSFEDNFGSDANIRVELLRKDRNIIARLYDGLTLNLVAEVSSEYQRSIIPAYGLGYDYPAVTITQGKIYLSKITLLAPYSDNCFLYIVGDSITEGVPVKQEDAWAYKVANIIPNTIVSGRGGGGIPGVLAKINSEVEKLKPKYVMVTVGTNDYDTVNNLSTLVANIKAKGAIPIINCVPCYPAGTSTASKLKTTINNAILALGEKCVRFDIATSLNYALQEPDESLYVSDLVHPNEAGHLRMFTRVQIDVPELFNF